MLPNHEGYSLAAVSQVTESPHHFCRACCNCTACAAHCSRLQFSVAVWQRQIMSTRLMLCSTTEMAPDPYALITDVYLDDEL